MKVAAEEDDVGDPFAAQPLELVLQDGPAGQEDQGFGRSLVRGRRRSPLPPARMKAYMLKVAYPLRAARSSPVTASSCVLASRPASRRRTSALSVRSHGASMSSRPKWP